MTIVFYVAGAVAIIATVLMLTGRNAVHALLYLIVSLLAVSVVFYTLGAPFIAALEIIIYAGAIMVLFVFVVMLLNLGSDASREENALLRPSVWIGPSVLAAILAAEFVYLLAEAGPSGAGITVVGPVEVGSSLFGPYLIGVELASMLLLGGLVGAYHLGRRRASSAGVR
jgi:NADH-quinone oxidoreductase subunit J